MLASRLMNDHEVPPVETQRGEGAAASTVMPWWKRVLEANGLSVAAVLVAALWVTKSIGELDKRVTVLEHRMGSFDESMKSVKDRLNMVAPGTEDEGKVLPLPEPRPTTDSSPKPQPPPAADDAPAESQPIIRPLRTVPPHIAPKAPSVCVHRSSFRIMDCHLADPETCFGREAFSPQHFEAARERSGAGDSMLLCDVKQQ